MTTGTETYKKHLLLPLFVWAIASAYFFFDYLQQMAPGVMGPELIEAYHVQAGALGILSAFYFYSYAVMQIPVGVITDHFGPHRPLVIAAFVAMGGSLLFAMSESLAGAEVSRMVIGAGAAFSYVSCLKIISNWFPAGRFATMAGLTSLVGMIGAISGGAPLADVVDHLDWRGTAVMFAAVGAGLAVLIWIFVRDHPSRATRWEDHPEHSRGVAKTWLDIKHVLSRPQLWITGIYATTMNITFTAFGATWGTSYIQKVYNIDNVPAATAVSMLFAGGLMGGPFWGMLSDRIRRRKLPMLLSSVSSIVVMIVILYAPGLSRLPLSATYALLILQGFCCNGLVLGYSVGHDIRPPGSAGVSVGFVNTICAGGTALFLPIIGWLSTLKEQPVISHGIHALTVGDYRFALTFLIVALGIAVIAALLIRETHCKLLYDKEEQGY